MARYGKDSKRKTATILEEAVKFFGDEWGLALEQQTQTRVLFTGGGGHVSVQVNETDQGSDVELETREWDRQAEKFLRRI